MILGPPGPTLLGEERKCNLQTPPTSVLKTEMRCFSHCSPLDRIRLNSGAPFKKLKWKAKQIVSDQSRQNVIGQSAPTLTPRKSPASAFQRAPQAGGTQATEVDVPVRPPTTTTTSSTG